MVINMDYIKKVAEFHKTFGHPILDKPTIPDLKRCLLRAKLIQEELNEFITAAENLDIVEVADALCDIQYVLSGTILEFGLAEKFPQLFEEVHRSNMSKACKDKEELELNLDYYTEQGAIVKAKTAEPPYILESYSGKIMKNINYSKADLKSILEQ